MRFPSVSLVASEAAAVFRRFPVALLLALAASTAGILAAEGPENPDLLLRLLYSATLGLPLSVALTMLSEKRKWNTPVRVLLHLGGLAVLAALFAVWPLWRDPVALRRYIQFSLGFHLLASVLPFASPGEQNGFWQYNKALFIRFLIAGLYAGVLYAGLAVAVLALDKLFGLHVPEERYLQLWILTAFVFTTWFFLGGIPADLNRLDGAADYPRGLRVFSQFILLPLVAVYLVILTLYMGKIMITWVWPSGWIGYLVSSVAVVGILLQLLMFPVQERAENRWVRTYSQGFYTILLPSVAMLFLAVFKRIGQYGLTENRYFMVVLASWLAAIALYSVFRKGKNIKVIPATLCVLAFATAFGPWGAYAMSARSQTERLRNLLEDHGILVNGRIQDPVVDAGSLARSRDMPFRDRQQVSAALLYLLEAHGTDSVAGWFRDGLAWTDTVDVGRGNDHRWADFTTRRIMETMGLDFVSPRQREDLRFFSYAPPPPRAVSLSGYDHAFSIETLHDASVVLEGKAWDLAYEATTVSLRLSRDGETLIRIPLEKAVAAADAKARAPDAPPPEEAVTIRTGNEHVSVLVLVRSLQGKHTGDVTEVTGFSGVFFVRSGS